MSQALSNSAPKTRACSPLQLPMSKLWSQVAQTSGAQLAVIAGSVSSLGITARVLGPDGRGQYAAAITWVGLFAIMGSLSLGQVLVHSVAGRPREEWVAPTAGTVAAILAMTTVIGWIAATVLYFASEGSAFGGLPPLLLALAFAALPFVLAAEPLRYLLLALDALHVANAAQVAGVLSGVIGVVALVLLLRLDVPGALLAFTLASAVPVGVGLTRVAREVVAPVLSIPLGREMLVASGKIHLSTIGTYFFSQASVLVLNNYRSPAEAGYYQLAVQLFGIALVVTNAVSTVAYGLVSRSGPDGAWAEQRRLVAQALLLAAVLAAIAYPTVPVAVRLLAGEAFMPVVPVFRLLLPGLLGATFAATMASQWIGRGLFWQAGLLTFAVGVVSVATSIALVPRYGALGAACGTLLAYLVAVVGNGIMAIRIDLRTRAARRGRTP